MLSKLSVRRNKHLLAKIANKCAPCAFCRREIDDEVIYGKLYAIGDIHVHYFCVLLSCCLIQKGKDEEGLFGFLYPDILAEIERSKKHRCSYCNKEGATLGCAITQCRKQFHLPCGREKNAISMFHGNYKSFCWNHAPKQKVANNILENIKERKIKERKLKAAVGNVESKSEGFIFGYHTIFLSHPRQWGCWPPCCARDAWFHRSCLQRMALSAGMHYLKCPLCNDKEQFLSAVMGQGYYIPDRDAAWELEQNAFAEIYERRVACNMADCSCPQGREYDADNGSMALRSSLVSLPDPSQNTASRTRHGPVMPSRMSLRRTKPKLSGNNVPSSSNINREIVRTNYQTSDNTMASRGELNLKPPKRRIAETYYKNLENKLQSPIKLLEKRLCEKLEHIETLDSFAWDSSEVIDAIREKIRKPRPLAVKKRIVNSVIDNVLNNILKERTKVKEPVREWISPKKSCDITDAVSQKMEVDLIQDIKRENCNTQDIPVICQTLPNVINKNDIENKQVDSSNILTEEFLDKNLPIISPKSKPVIVNTDSAIEISKNDQKLDISVVKMAPCDKDNIVPLKFSPRKEMSSKNMEIDLESFKNQYLNEVGRDSNKNHLDSTKSDEEKSKYRSKIRKTKDKKRDNKSAKSKIRKRNATDNAKSENVDLVFEMSENVTRKKKEVTRKKRRETELSIRDKNIHVNIKWRREKFKLKITKSKEERKVLKQYVLNYPERSERGVLIKPVTEVSPIRRKSKKSKQKPDNLVQTSIANFFKIKTPEK
ncbi:uncharacterized protein LOC119839211 [Zerene cesonia]|uniref:uncharacterized protein LOC119839211 n=1 Tax=Zerene cesonia TaxID=33412 RepID=UPI0018E50417|nr:uncharacterized protein LOC119839211 [Zerene cesonia]